MSDDEDIDLIELITRFQRRADKLLRGQLMDKSWRSPRLFQEDVVECVVVLCERWRRALDEVVDPDPIEAKDLITKLYASARAQTEVWREARLRGLEIEDARHRRSDSSDDELNIERE